MSLVWNGFSGERRSPCGLSTRLVLLLIGLISATMVRGADGNAVVDPKPKVGPPPSWIVTNTFVRSPITSVQPGEEQRLLLFERQINAAEAEAFYHSAVQLLTVSGVQNGSTVSIDFDPSYETLTLHSIKVWRGTNAVDHLDPERISTIRRERDLDRYLFNGESSAVLVLRDVRVGDVVEHSYTLRGANPVFEGKFHARVSAQLPIPANRLMTRLLWPSSRKLQVKNHNFSMAATRKETNGVTEFLWDFRNVTAFQREKQMPSWHNPEPWVQLSEFQTWGEVAKWAVSLFSGDLPLPSELETKIAEWKRLRAQEQQVLAALHFVQDEIRYFGVEMGAGSHKPSSPGEVFRRRFGDCKDKTLLFVRIMAALGVEAYPVLLNTDLGKGVASWHPTAIAFDHVIATVRLSGRSYWVDPTAGYQRGPLSAHYLPDYGQGLVVSSNTTVLSLIPPPSLETMTSTTESYAVGQPRMKSTLKVVTLAAGRDAESLRAFFGSNSRDMIEKSYLEYYGRAHPGISLAGAITVADDEQRNRFTVTENYSIPDIWVLNERSQRLTAEFFPYQIAALLEKPVPAFRRHPFAVSHPQRRLVRTEIQWPAIYVHSPDNAVVNGGAFRFRKQLRREGQKTTLEHEYLSLQDSVPANFYPRHLQDLTKAAENLGLIVTWQ